jgi:hypothetical protein
MRLGGLSAISVLGQVLEAFPCNKSRERSRKFNVKIQRHAGEPPFTFTTPIPISSSKKSNFSEHHFEK